MCYCEVLSIRAGSGNTVGDPATNPVLLGVVLTTHSRTVIGSENCEQGTILRTVKVVILRTVSVTAEKATTS